MRWTDGEGREERRKGKTKEPRPVRPSDRMQAGRKDGMDGATKKGNDGCWMLSGWSWRIEWTKKATRIEQKTTPWERGVSAGSGT